MTAAAAAHRRRAAYSVLQPVLGPAALAAAADSQTALPSDSVADIIAYVDGLCAAHDLGDDTRRQLYADLFEALRRPSDSLQGDPFQSHHADEPGHGSQPQAAASLHSHSTASAWPASGALSPLSLTGAGLPGARGAWRAPATATTVLQPEQQVFDALMQALMQLLHDEHADQLRAVQEASLAEFARAPLSAVTRETVSTAWHQRPDQAWRIAAPSHELAELVHRMHLTLSRLLGDLQADQLLTQAARSAATCPAAASYPPGRLL